MYKRLTSLLNEYIPQIKISSLFMNNGYLRHSIHGNVSDDFEIFKDSGSLRFIKFETPDSEYGEEFFVFKIVTYIYSDDQDSAPVYHGSEHYDPDVEYHFRNIDFAEPTKVSLRWNNNVYICDGGIDAVIYRDDKWDGYIIPKNMSQEEHFQNTLHQELPPYALFDGIYNLIEVETFSTYSKENMGKISNIELFFLNESEEYFNDLENCLKFMVKMTRKFNETHIV